MVCRLYRAASKRWGPDGLTLSAFAFKYAQETGNVFWRVKVDAIFMLLTGQEQHCQQQYQRERATTLTHEGSRQ